MKTKSYIKAILAAVLICTGLSCCTNMDYPDRYQPADGIPAVYSVRYADKDQTISSAFMKEVICILGDNLRSVNQIWFNDQQAVLNTSYITDNTLLVEVPGALPAEKTDKIYLMTKDGQIVTVDFKVLAPAPKVTGMSFEYAQAGETVTITGNFFVEPVTVTFTGGAEAQVSNVTMTSMDVVIPKGALPGKVKVETESGIGQSAFNYMDDRGILFNFEEGGLKINGWNAPYVFTDATDGYSGGYLQFGDNDSHELAGDGSTWSEGAGGYSMPYWPGSWNDPEDYAEAPRLTDIVDFTNYADMCIKFEMCISEDTPWKSNAMQIIPAPVTAISLGNNCQDIFGNTVAGQNNTYYHEDLSLPRAIYAPWKGSGSFHTGGKWITVTIPFSDFKYDWDGTSLAKGSLNADSFASLTIFFHGLEGEDCKPIIKIDNIRAVPNK